jgi:exopolysaccharide biosynthesis protein
MTNKLCAAKRAVSVILKTLAVFFTTLALIVVALLGVIYVLVKGPSPTAKKLFVLSVRETSAVGFLADIYLSDEELATLTVSEIVEEPKEKTDTSLIEIPTPTPSLPPSGEDTDITDTVLEEKDIEVVRIKGSLYEAVMLIVKDPLRVFVGTPDELGGKGLKLTEMVEKYDAVAGINAGGFYDPFGGGHEGTPDGMVICNGEVVWGDPDVKLNVSAFDDKGILHVGMMTTQEAMDAKIQWAVSFGPPLIINGKVQSFEKDLISGLNPRTAIGQRADGAVLMLVVDGRRMNSLGATYADLADIMLDFGAVNASNLDGGSSTLMIYEGEVLNVCASVTGPRALPTSFLVR